MDYDSKDDTSEENCEYPSDEAMEGEQMVCCNSERNDTMEERFQLSSKPEGVREEMILSESEVDDMIAHLIIEEMEVDEMIGTFLVTNRSDNTF